LAIGFPAKWLCFAKIRQADLRRWVGSAERHRKAAIILFSVACPELALFCISRNVGAVPLASFGAFAAGTGARNPACPLQK
jgi:hypothetical protein